MDVMACELDGPISRRGTGSLKWDAVQPGVLPMWVADMDFLSPEPVRRALAERVQHGVFGYGIEPPELRLTIVERLERLYAWQVAPEAIVFLPGVIPGLNVACRAYAHAGQSALMQTPVYPGILQAPGNCGLTPRYCQLRPGLDGSYGFDEAEFEAAIAADTAVFILCSPHNPVGRVWKRQELELMAEACLSHGMTIISDEIHCDLVLGGQLHLPIAALDPDVSRRTITLMAPSKTFNIAGLGCAFAVIEDEEMRRRFEREKAGLVSEVNIMGFVAALAAYRQGQPWLDEVLGYLRDNRDLVLQFAQTRLHGISLPSPEGTYLAWLDCRGLAGSQPEAARDPHGFFLERAHVALSEGPAFGPGGEGHVRLNFGCPRSMLLEALERMAGAIA